MPKLSTPTSSSESLPLHGRWALILGGSSGFGLASALELARLGMNICVVHRDRKGALSRIEEGFEQIRAHGVQFLSFNTNALVVEERKAVLDVLAGQESSVALLLHSIAFGSLKLLAPRQAKQSDAIPALAARLGVEPAVLQAETDALFESGHAELARLSSPVPYEGEHLLEEEELLGTISAMGTSFYTWTKEIFSRNMFSPDARVLGLTSEGNDIAWLGYAAVSAAKVTLESLARSMALEFGPYGIRTNVVQAGVTNTAALRHIPGNDRLLAQAKLRNPLQRTTQVEDVAKVIGLLARPEAAWINGSIIRVDGGEKISGL
jgi:NAD(P)-dependent dehydrogenase (short-subunit alcohol dehydrogenase family)